MYIWFWDQVIYMLLLIRSCLSIINLTWFASNSRLLICMYECLEFDPSYLYGHCVGYTCILARFSSSVPWIYVVLSFPVLSFRSCMYICKSGHRYMYTWLLLCFFWFMKSLPKICIHAVSLVHFILPPDIDSLWLGILFTHVIVI